MFQKLVISPPIGRTSRSSTASVSFHYNPWLAGILAFCNLSGNDAMHCWARYLLWMLILILGVGNMITACGQKGKLFIPEQKAEQSVIKEDESAQR
jgi:predicted small lipoprotein YifL